VAQQWTEMEGEKTAHELTLIVGRIENIFMGINLTGENSKSASTLKRRQSRLR
jgi:hypothetical protein